MEIRTRFDQRFQKSHLSARWPYCGAHPIPVGLIDGSVAGIRKLPDRVMTIRYTATAGKDRTINLLTHVVVAKVASRRIPLRPRIVRMVLVIRFQVERRLCGR